MIKRKTFWSSFFISTKRGKQYETHKICIRFSRNSSISRLLNINLSCNTVRLVAYTDWHETEEKDKSGKWVNYNYDWMFKPGAMAEVAKYADGVGPGWYMLIDKEKSKVGNIVYTPLVKELAQYKMELHPYTVRKDALPEFFTNIDEMYDALLNKAGATAVFTDFPDTGVEFLKKGK